MFMSPRSDLTIRNLTAEQVEKICNAAVDIVGGVVSFSESAIYESEDTTQQVLAELSCGSTMRHSAHSWRFSEWNNVLCPGKRNG